MPPGIRVFLAVRVFSTVALLCLVTVVAKQVYDITQSGFYLGLVGLAEFVPLLLVSPFTGLWSDRVDRKKLLVIGYLGELASALGLAVYSLTDPISVWPIYALIMLLGFARGTVSPAVRAIPVDLATPGTLERIIARVTLAAMVGFILGPVIGGVLYDIGLHYAYGLSVLGFAIAAALMPLITSVEVPRTERAVGAAAVWRSAFEGLAFIRRTPVLLGAITLDLMAVLIGGVVVLLPAIAEERLGVGAVGYGWLRAAIGIGSFAMGAAIAVRPVTRYVGPTLFAVVAIFGGATVVLGFTRNYVVAFLAVLIMSGADAVSVFIRTTLTPTVTPPSMRGRVMATEQIFIGASNELGSFESGVVALLLGTTGAVITGGIGTLIVVMVWWKLFPQLARIDQFSELEVSKVGVSPEPA